MSQPTSSADYSACRTVRVCGRGVFKRVARADADQLIACGWARWLEYGVRVELTEAAPISTLKRLNPLCGPKTWELEAQPISGAHTLYAHSEAWGRKKSY